MQSARSGGSQQFVGYGADAFLQLRFASLPCFSAEPVQHDAVSAFTIAAEDIDIFYRDVELVTAGIFQMDAVMGAFADRD